MIYKFTLEKFFLSVFFHLSKMEAIEEQLNKINGQMR